MNYNELLSILIQGIPFVALFAAVTAAVIMYRVTQKFGGGILASGFKSITYGVVFLALGMFVDAVISYFVLLDYPLSPLFLIVKGFFFVVGTYIIVIGSKKTADRLESLL